MLYRVFFNASNASYARCFTDKEEAEHFYGDTDFIRQRKDEATQAIDHLGITKKEKNDMHNTVADLLCDVEERAFKDGLHYGIDLMTGRMFSEY